MDTNWLEDFVSFARSLNFTKAAAERNITQSAYSRRIKSLETWLGVELIDRKTFPATLSPAGDEFLPTAKNALYNDIPLIFGVGLTDSFNALSSDDSSSISSSSGLWEPKSYEDRLGGHALTIVGYDDYKFGGSFRVVNSWGREWGDNGYFWIKYSDFIENVKVAYIMFVDDELGKQNPQIDLKN